MADRRQLAMFRRPQVRASFALPGELVVDNFAGGGGASTGIEAALGRPVDIAINHDAEAIAMHAINHPRTKHYCENIWEVDPREACGRRPVGLAWFSPDCDHFSRARGTKPVQKEIRGLAWVVIRWAKTVRPRTIILENVQEFETWGPVVDGRPDPARAGSTFRQWLGKLRGLGYSIEFRSLVAADYGAPTTRKRLYLIATRDDAAIVWPDPTHGKGRRKSWRTAAEVIDWSLPCPSIFERKRPLAEATLRRIAAGIRRYVIEAPRPFIIPVTHQGDARVHGLGEPLRTVTGAHRGEFALASPFIVRHGHYSHRTGAGLREGCGAGTFRGQELGHPLATVCGTNDKHLVVPLITKHYGGMVGHDVERPIGAITSQDHHALTAAFLTKFYGTSTGAEMHGPMPTITALGQHIAEVRAFLLKYNGTAIGARIDDPMHTVTANDRFALVEVAGEQYAIADIGMRMLQPHELYAAQGFPDDYVIGALSNGKRLTKTAQIKLVGNSVCPPVAEALVAAQVRAARRAA